MERKGSTEPRIFTPPLRNLTRKTSAGFEAVEFAEDVLGITLFPWQRWLLHHALELTDDGLFRFRTLIVLVARQNGKSTLAQVWSLWRIYMDMAPLVIGTAQNLDLAEEVWAGAVDMAESVPELKAEIASVDRTNGKKALRLEKDRRYKVAAASRRGGRGLSGDFVLLDELREHHNWDAWGAVTKTTLARPRAQILGLSNAGDDASIVLNHLRTIAIQEKDKPDSDIGIFEWSAPDDCEMDDRDAWAMANPSLGYTITEKAIAASLTTDPPHVFRTEVLCQRVDMSAQSPLPQWAERLEADSTINADCRLAFAVDTSWDRSTSWISVAGIRPDGRIHVEIAASGIGQEWIIPWLLPRMDAWNPVAVGIQESGAPVSVIADQLAAAIGSSKVVRFGRDTLGKSCGALFDAVTSAKLVHTGQDQLTMAAQSATIRPLGDMWVFDRKKSSVDVAPLMAAAEALFLVDTWQEPEVTKVKRTGAVYAF